jgi:hypothetical protein
MKWARITRTKALIAIIWPSFLVAGVFTGVLFAFVDPYVLMYEVGVDSTSRLTGYSLAFLYFWVAGMVAAFFAMYILCTPEPGSRRESPREPRL